MKNWAKWSLFLAFGLEVMELTATIPKNKTLSEWIQNISETVPLKPWSCCFLAHLSTKCSRWAIVVSQCPLSNLLHQQIAKMVPIGNPRGMPWWPSWKSIFMPQPSKKLEGHIAYRLFVRPSVRSSRFLMHSITLKPWKLLFWNFIYGFLMKK